MFVHKKKISIISILSLTGSNFSWKEILSVEIVDKIVLRKPEVWAQSVVWSHWLSLCRMLSVVHWCCALLTLVGLKDDIFPWIESLFLSQPVEILLSTQTFDLRVIWNSFSISQFLNKGKYSHKISVEENDKFHRGAGKRTKINKI